MYLSHIYIIPIPQMTVHSVHGYLYITRNPVIIHQFNKSPVSPSLNRLAPSGGPALQVLNCWSPGSLASPGYVLAGSLSALVHGPSTKYRVLRTPCQSHLLLRLSHRHPTVVSSNLKEDPPLIKRIQLALLHG
jgi:hypothetical protein